MPDYVLPSDLFTKISFLVIAGLILAIVFIWSEVILEWIQGQKEATGSCTTVPSAKREHPASQRGR